jgi:hypothetical protein
MPYPETCPECGGAFRNTGTHYTSRRNELGRHVLLELGCQNTSRRYWWDFTSGSPAEDGSTPGRRSPSTNGASNGALAHETNGRSVLATLEPPETSATNGQHVVDDDPVIVTAHLDTPSESVGAKVEAAASRTVGSDSIAAMLTGGASLGSVEPGLTAPLPVMELSGPPPAAPVSLREAFVRQLQLDRLTLRQMRSWLMADDARRAMEVAAGATEATYERLALILFGADLPQLLGKQSAPPPTPGMSAEERLELQREKARIRARQRRAAAKAARQG